MESIAVALLLASPLVLAPIDLLQRILPVLGEILGMAVGFRSGPISPASVYEFETQLSARLRELGRVIVEWTYNTIESNDLAAMPQELRSQNEVYRRGSKKRRRGTVATLFGPIVLLRFLYRAATLGEPALFPLEINLGIEPWDATPALALKAGFLATAMTQAEALAVLHTEHGVVWSVARFRKVVAAVSLEMSEQRHERQAARLLELLENAAQSKGHRKIVVSVGRDGLFLPIRKSKSYQEAATATVAVYDRSGRRLGTVYLGRMPEPGQGTLTEQLDRLLKDVLMRWQGPLPRLCYVTDAGHHPTEYFENSLRGSRHPRTGEPLHWERIVDYYHACGYISNLAEAIFGAGKEAAAWSRKMRRWLRDKPRGAYRVLHSAAALKDKRGLAGPAKQFAVAYRYLRDRLDYLDYVDYRRRGLPIGSGVTEAACKIVFTCRFKRSGMKWSVEGGQTILDLRILRLSNVWDTARAATLAAKPTLFLHPPTNYGKHHAPSKIAA